MEGRSTEFAPIEQEKTDDGYSEARQSRIVEGKAMDGKQVKKRKPVTINRILRPARTTRQSVRTSVPVSRKERILVAYKQNSAAIVKLVETLHAIDGANFRQEEQIIAEIKDRRHLQEELLNALILEQKSQLTEEAISKEAWNLIN